MTQRNITPTQIPSVLAKQEPFMTHPPAFPRSTPEAQGIPSGAISAFISAAERDLDALHSFIPLRHGHVVAAGWWQPYRPLDQRILFSLSKSFTSTAIGLLVAEGRLSLDDPVLAFFPDETPSEPSANLQAMRVRHLLSMSSGHALDTTGPMTEDPNGSDWSDWQQGYGYQFWRCRHDAYRGDGAFGQYCVVMPAQDAVLAITAGFDDMQQPLELAWEHLLPAMGSAPLPDDEEAQTALVNTLADLHLRTPQGQRHAPIAARVSGKRFIMDENTEQIAEIRFDFDAAETLITISNEQGEQRIACGHDRWLRGAASLGPLATSARPAALRHPGPWKVGASGAWTDEATYTAKLWWYETPLARTLTCRFAGDRLTVAQENNVGFGATEGPQLQGRMTQRS